MAVWTPEIKELCECQLGRSRGTEPLKGIIDKLHKERKVPDHIATSMHGLNDLLPTAHIPGILIPNR